MDTPLSYTMSLADVGELESLVDKLDSLEIDPAAPYFFDQAWDLTAMVPSGVRRFLAEFCRDERAATCTVRGWPIGDRALGPTPANWSEAAAQGRGRREEFVLGLLAMCLTGETFSWSTLQGGRLLHNVVPIAGDEQEQSGHGQVLLEWHTEDGFHPYRCDYLLLFGMRNPDHVPTLVSSVRDVRLDEADLELLRQPRFHIMPDNEHLRQMAEKHPGHPSLLRARKMRDEPRAVPVLFGAPESPYLRIDPYFMRCADDDPAVETALRRLIDEMNRVQQRIEVEPGTLLVVDNYLAVHGRAAFRARFDGTDRWLKKALVTRDLRVSRDMRESPSSRVIV
ncbi:guanitoxin biosynthesis L-enduracididine beta-hydroxylase GntD [Actinomadura macra]|uniref:guanitoxin biosynthesis L-enduracididine beta-hydroxylase GntD n=1 Tax=Actinomadura macra TaxID=46164 RepID=UPI0008307291|nr:guanitoxin biosynthesis L-enduracididine beta-hydroxylase GntD [Actinomadura macra]